MATALVNAEADVTIPDGNSTTALHIAAKIGDERLARLLLTNGADVSSSWFPPPHECL